MKVRCEIDIETKTGDYEIRFWNLEKPGQGIEYNEVSYILKQIFGDVDKQVKGASDTDPQVFKEIH